MNMLALTGLRAQYPQAAEAELRRRLAGLLLGEELARKVYGDLPGANWAVVNTERDFPAVLNEAHAVYPARRPKP
jgi:hypothetical protein